jgi:predicted hotdog family 3-hydroxylacyl-ACP dehydratase
MRVAINLPAPAADLIPHRPPVRLIENLLEVHADGGRAGTTVRADSLHVNADGTLDPTAHLELMGQTFAAAKGWRDRQQDWPPRVGFLAGATGMDCLNTARIGDQLTIAIKQTGTFGAFAMIEGQVHRHDRRIAGGQLKLWLTPSHHASPDTTNETSPKLTLPPTSLKNAIQAASDQPLKRKARSRHRPILLFPAGVYRLPGPLSREAAAARLRPDPDGPGHTGIRGADAASTGTHRQRQIPGTAASRTIRPRSL